MAICCIAVANLLVDGNFDVTNNAAKSVPQKKCNFFLFEDLIGISSNTCVIKL